MCHYLVKQEGIFAGPSSGANVCGAFLTAKKLGPGHVIVTFLCDHGSKYQSKTYNPDWLRGKHMESALDTHDLTFMEESLKLNGL